jgi:hypothetical protein
MNLFSIIIFISSFINTLPFNTKPVKLSTTKFKNSNGFKTIEPLENHNNNNAIVFCTGASGKISSDIYSQFLSNIANNNITCYVYNGDFDVTNSFINKISSKHNEVSVVGHSSGSMNAVQLASKNKYVKNIIILDPVDDRILYENRISFLFNYFFNKKDNVIDLYNINNFLIIYAGKSYEWNLPNFQIPFIPIFSLNKKDLSFNNKQMLYIDEDEDEDDDHDEPCCDEDNCNHESCENDLHEEILSDVGIINSIRNKLKSKKHTKTKIIHMPEYGHSDLLDDFWANSAHDTIIKGTSNRNPNELENYRNFLANAIAIVVNNNMTSFRPLRFNNIPFKVKNN